jgi:radical SAM superfamily enzyme YgiQ (UPF0313 family)
MIDIVIISVPGVMRKTPQAAPALLKASVESAGFSCRTVDFNLRFYQEVVDSPALETYFSTGLNTEEMEQANALVASWAEYLAEMNPKFVGISVFTYQNRVASELFCRHLRRLNKDIKIILGGQGLSEGGIQGVSGFGKQMFDQGLADFWIRSEGEISLVELLKNNIDYPGINSDTFEQIENLDAVPFPNYDDYELELYETRSLPITGSRGCVRACSFCDIHEHWKYRFRTGQNMADELLYLNERYAVTQFNFSDSLINGSLKEFKKFTKIIAEHNRNRLEEDRLYWGSQFIVRPKGQVDEQYWQDIADSGGRGLAIGVETGSDTVRTHMNKKFSNEDLDYTMEMLDKYNITCIFLMIVGYPTETEEDFQATMDMFTRYEKYKNVIKGINVGSTLGILPGTPLFNTAKELNIIVDKYENNWVALNNPELTLERRLQRREELHNHLTNLGHSIISDATEHMMKILYNNLDMFNQRTKMQKMIHLKNITKNQF